MANIKSAIKRNKQNEKRRIQNRYYRGRARTLVAKAKTAIETGSESTEQEVLLAISALDKAAIKGIIHKNNAARRKSRLMQKLNAVKTA